jgi:4-amino-4-deoxy-L-arabinose transferase-like glycosyltransferase
LSHEPKRVAPAFGAGFERPFAAAIAVSAVLFAAALTWSNAHNLNLGIVSHRSVDEFFFVRVLARMYDGMLALDARNFFNISFFNYGFPYFFAQMILSMPALMTHSLSAVLLIARSFSLAWTVAAMLLGAWWVARRTGSWAFALLAFWLVAAMPGIVEMSTVAHPDTMMSFFLLAAFVAAAELDPARSRSILIVAGLCGLGACAKIQIGMYLPFVGAFLALRVFLDRAGAVAWPSRAVSAVKAGAAVGLLPPLIYLVLNPFLLRGEAFHAFLRDFRENMESNATNHFAYALPTASDKLDMLTHSYYPASAVLAAVAVLALLAAWRRLAVRDLIPEIAIAGTGLLTATYIFISVQKIWTSYYLPSFVLLAVALVSLAGRAAPAGRAARIGTGLALAGALLAVALRLPSAVVARIFDDGPDLRQSEMYVSLVAEPLKHIRNARVMLTPYTPFEFERLGLRITQVTVVAGTLGAYETDKADMLVLRKNDMYFDRVQLAQQSPRGVEIRQSRARIESMLAGTEKEFLLCAQNSAAYVFCRRSAYATLPP